MIINFCLSVVLMYILVPHCSAQRKWWELLTANIKTVEEKGNINDSEETNIHPLHHQT